MKPWRWPWAKACLGGAACGLLHACTATPNPLTPGRTGSVGMPHQGVQRDAVELPIRGAGYRRFRPHGRANWGQPELVATIEQTAKELTRTQPGAPPMVIGDLSARFGGRVPRHNSHRSGRDVDLLWFLRTLEGRPVVSPGFLRVGADGLARDPSSGRYYLLDVPRQWEALRELLLNDAAPVQWMLCSRDIEALLIRHAMALGEPAELVWQAETVLLQPADSLPHDDHIHLRISCTPSSSATGCMGGGPYWPWLPPLPTLKLDEEDLEEIGREDPLPSATDQAGG